MFATIAAALSFSNGLPSMYWSCSISFGATPASSFGIMSARRPIISSASCSARAFADSSLRCFASSNATSAAYFVFSHSASTSSMLIWPVIWCSNAVFSGIYIPICPSCSSASSSLKLIFNESSISWSVSICSSVSSSSSDGSYSSFGSCKYGISSTSFLMLSILSVTVSFSVACMICCMLFCSSSCRFCVLKRSGESFTFGICTGSLTISPDSRSSSGRTSTTPSFLRRNCRYFSSCCLVSGW